MSFNPYDYMLWLRNNKLMFQYMDICNVTLTNDHGWTIEGESAFGYMNCYMTTGNLIRIIMPIKLPGFLPLEYCNKLIVELQDELEGVVALNYNPDVSNYSTDVVDSPYYIEYYFSVLAYDEEMFNACLIKFFQERTKVYEIFKELKTQFNIMKESVMNKEGGDNKDIWSFMQNLENSPGEDDELNSEGDNL